MLRRLVLISFHIPHGMRSEIRGLSHGLKKCPPDTFLHQSADWCRSFESHRAIGSFLVTRRGLVCIFADGENRGSDPSSRIGQPSTGRLDFIFRVPFVET